MNIIHCYDPKTADKLNNIFPLDVGSTEGMQKSLEGLKLFSNCARVCCNLGDEVTMQCSCVFYVDR